MRFAKCFLYDEEKKLLSWKDIDLKKCASSEIYVLQGIEMYLEGEEMTERFLSLPYTSRSLPRY